jgi:hypothetical protein
LYSSGLLCDSAVIASAAKQSVCNRKKGILLHKKIVIQLNDLQIASSLALLAMTFGSVLQQV